MKLNFTMSELLYSDTAKHEKLINVPTDTKILDNILLLITECLQPLRDYIGKPIKITSGYRSELVNHLVGGARNSQHISGNAADFIVPGLSISEVIQKIKNSGIEYDQLINEGAWVHISYNKGKNRKQYLKLG